MRQFFTIKSTPKILKTIRNLIMAHSWLCLSHTCPAQGTVSGGSYEYQTICHRYRDAFNERPVRKCRRTSSEVNMSFYESDFTQSKHSCDFNEYSNDDWSNRRCEVIASSKGVRKTDEHGEHLLASYRAFEVVIRFLERNSGSSGVVTSKSVRGIFACC